MELITILAFGLALTAMGAGFLYYHFRAARRFETLIAVVGGVLVVCGLAVVRDGVSGSRRILWMLPSHAAPVSQVSDR